MKNNFIFLTIFSCFLFSNIYAGYTATPVSNKRSLIGTYSGRKPGEMNIERKIQQKEKEVSDALRGLYAAYAAESGRSTHETAGRLEQYVKSQLREFLKSEEVSIQPVEMPGVPFEGSRETGAPGESPLIKWRPEYAPK